MELGGRFTSDGTNQVIQVRSDIDWMWVINETNAGATGNDSAVFYWQRGMAAGTGIRYFKSGGGNNLNLTTLADPNGFTLLDTSTARLGAAVAITASTNVVRPIVSTGSTAGLFDGSIVRLSGVTGQPNLNGYDFAIDTIVANTSFRLAGALATAPGAAGTAGNYRIVNFDPFYYPPFRFILNVTQATSAVVTLSVPSQYVVGQRVKFSIPNANFGMTELDGLEGTVTAVDDTVATQTITVNIDSSGFSAFTFPTAAQAATPFAKAMVHPVGMDTAQALTSSVDILGGAVSNQGFIGMRLAGGADSPGGSNNDVIYWRTGKLFSVDNQ